MLNTNHTSPKNVFASFEHKMIPTGQANKPSKKRNIHISINRGPTPSFQINKMTNIATCYKETSEKIKQKNDQSTKKTKNLIEKNKKQEKDALYVNALHSMRNLDEGKDNNIGSNCFNRLLPRDLSIPNRNLTNYNPANGSNSLLINKTNNNNSSINSSYFPKNTITTSQLSQLNDSNSTSKIHITFTHRNYNDSVNANNSLNEYKTKPNNTLSNPPSNYINNPNQTSQNSNQYNTNVINNANISGTGIKLSSSGNFSNIKVNTNSSVSLSINNLQKKNKSSTMFSTGNKVSTGNNVLNVNQSQGVGLSSKFDSSNSNSNNSKKLQFLNVRNKSASSNNGAGSSSYNNNVNNINFSNNYSNYSNYNTNSYNNYVDESREKDNKLIINTNTNTNGKILPVSNMSNPISLSTKNSYTRKNSLNMSSNCNGNKISTNKGTGTYLSTHSNSNNYITNLIRPSAVTNQNYCSNNTDLGQYTQPAIELSSSLKPSDMEEVRKYVKMNKIRSGSLADNSSHIKNLVGNSEVTNTGSVINAYKSKHSKRNSSVGICNNININNPISGIAGINLLKKERNFSRDRLLGVKSMDQITASELFNNINVKRAKENVLCKKDKDKEDREDNTNNSMKNTSTSTYKAAVHNFKKYIKNNKSLSLIGIKEKYKELLKNKNIPASIMIQSFKLSTDITNKYNDNENTKKEMANRNLNDDNHEDKEMNRIKELDDNIEDLVISSRDEKKYENNINANKITNKSVSKNAHGINGINEGNINLNNNNSTNAPPGNIPKIKNILINKNINTLSNGNVINPNNGNIMSMNINLEADQIYNQVNNNRPNTTKNKIILPFSKNSKDLQMQNLKFIIQDNCKNNINKNTISDLSNSNQQNHPSSTRGPVKKTITSTSTSIAASISKNNAAEMPTNQTKNTSNKILSMDCTYSNTNVDLLKENLITCKSSSIIQEEELETIKKEKTPRMDEPFDDDFDDLNSIIKHIKFENINIYKENIFSQNNFLYTNFEEKFNSEFDEVMLPNFLRR